MGLLNNTSETKKHIQSSIHGYNTHWVGRMDVATVVIVKQSSYLANLDEEQWAFCRDLIEQSMVA